MKQNPAGVPEKSTLDWMVVFLVYADFIREGETPLGEKLKRELNRLIEDLLSSPINPGVRITLAFNSLRFVSSDPGSSRINDETLVMEVVRGKKRNELVLLYKEEGKKFDNVEQLSDVFGRCYRAGDAKRIFLVTWDHGSAYGIFKEPEYVELLTPLSHDLRQYPALKYLFKVCKQPLVTPAGPAADGSTEESYRIGHVKFSTRASSAEPFLKKVKSSGNRLKVEVSGSDSSQPGLKSSVKTVMSLMAQPDDRLNGDNPQVRPSRAIFFRLLPTQAAGLFHTSPSLKLFVAAPTRKAPEVPANHFVAKESFKILTNEELAEAIAKGFGQPVDVLLMMNCWMANVYSSFAFSKPQNGPDGQIGMPVKFLVAPQTGIDEPGYHYRKIISRIDATCDTGKLAKACCDDMRLLREAATVQEQANIDSLALVGYDLAAFHDVHLKIDQIGDLVLRLLDIVEEEPQPGISARYMLTVLRRFCFEFNESEAYHLVDPVHWLNLAIQHNFTELSRGIPAYSMFTNLQTAVADLKRQIGAATFGFEGSKVYSINNDTRLRAYCKITNMSPSGCTIYFPLDARQETDLANLSIRLFRKTDFDDSHKSFNKLIATVFNNY